MSDVLRAALDCLLPEYRRIVALRYLEGYKLQDIARFLGISQATVKWRLAQAQRRLKQNLFIVHYGIEVKAFRLDGRLREDDASAAGG